MATNVQTSNLTSNINLLAPTAFKLTINKQTFANTEFFITSFSIPDISVTPIESNYRGLKSYDVGEPRTFGDLSIRFAVDENMQNYTEMYNWLQRNSVDGQSLSPKKITKGGVDKMEQHDMILSVLSSHNNVNKQFQFKDAFPISLGGVEFSTQTTSVEYLQADVSFRYGDFDIIK
jgi:hypothetical protein